MLGSVARCKEGCMDELLMPPFVVTPAAIAQIESLGGALLIDVERGGCCGQTYVFRTISAEEEVEAERYGCEGAWLFVGAGVAGMMPGATLDYAAKLRPPRFRVITNPNTPDVCPCRRSFGQPWPGRGSAKCRSYAPMPWDDHFDPPASWKRQTGFADTRDR